MVFHDILDWQRIPLFHSSRFPGYEPHLYRSEYLSDFSLVKTNLTGFRFVTGFWFSVPSKHDVKHQANGKPANLHPIGPPSFIPFPFMSVDFLVTVCHFPSFPLHSPCIPLHFSFLSPSCPVELPFVSMSFPLISCHVRFLSPACHCIFLDFPSCPLHVPFPRISPSFPVISMHFP